MCESAEATWQKISTSWPSSGASISSSVLPSTYSISSSHAGDLEPRLPLAAIKDLGDRRMVQLLGGLELGLRLLDVDLVLGLVLADDLQGVALAAGGLVADQKDRASRALAERVDHAVLHSGELGRASRRSPFGASFSRILG